ncbi:MAG: histidine phosphatase family protein [Hyphomicrobiaceae bacterium]
MRTLSLLRHAKSSWDDATLDDFDRPLAPRGRKAAPLMGRHMRDLGLAPDLVLCSSAARTRETAKLALGEFDDNRLPISHDSAIYEASLSSLIARLRTVDDGVRHLLMIGHNPGLQDLVLCLVGGRLDAAHETIAEKLPTAALVVLDLDIADWSAIGPGCGRITHFATPKLLKGD